MKKKLFILIYMALLSALLFADEKVQIQKITASSTLSEKGKASDFYGTENLTDNSYKSWVEGVDGDGTGESITFEFENVITKSNKTEPYTTYWGSDNYDYRSSVLNNFLNNETVGAESIINLLPNDLKKEGIIKTVDKLVGVNKTKAEGAENYKATSFEEGKYPKLFPLAYNEVHDPDGEFVTPGETDRIYKYYEGHGGDGEDMAYRVKNIVGKTSTNGENYWLRSPNTFSNIIAEVITQDGFINVYGVSYGEFAVAPAFCI